MSIKWFAKLSITFIYSKFHDLFCKILTELISCDIAKALTEVNMVKVFVVFSAGNLHEICNI